MRFLGGDFTSLPQLLFEYVPGGALENHNNISAGEGVQILRQCLEALMYLHGHNPPIVHRDIKPANILVQYRFAGNVYVKFADFGLSRDSPDPTTICGSRAYIAPELYNEEHRRNAHRKKKSYTPAVDIWSLGVTVFECVCDLPSTRARGISWCEAIVRKLNTELRKNPDELKRFLRENMVIMKPERRGSAQGCHSRILPLAGPVQDRSQTPTTASYARGYELSAGQDPDADEYDDDQATVVLRDAAAGSRPESTQDEDSAGEIRRYIRSEAPPPESAVPLCGASQNSFHESWLRDPLHPLGGGSTIAALGPGFDDSSCWATPLAQTPPARSSPDNEEFESLLEGVPEGLSGTSAPRASCDGFPLSHLTTDYHAAPKEKRKRSTRLSKSSSGGRCTKARGSNSFTASHRHYEPTELGAVYGDKSEQNNEGCGPVPQLFSEESNRAESCQNDLQAPEAGAEGDDDGSGSRGSDVRNHAQGWHERQQIGDNPWTDSETDSEARMAAALLCAIGQSA